MQLIPLQSKYTLLLYQIHLLITWVKYIEFIINHTSESYNKANKKELSSNDHKPNYSINRDYDAYANIGNHSNDNVEIYIANGAMSAAFRVAFNELAGSMFGKGALEAAVKRREDIDMSGGFSPLPADYLTGDGEILSLSLMSDGQMYPTELGELGQSYSFDPSSGLMNANRASGALEGVYPSTWIGGGRLVVAGGYKTISGLTRLSGASFANFKVGSTARNVWKLATGTLFIRPFGLKPASFYWAKSGGNFNAAVQALGRSNPVWNRRLIPLLPIGAVGQGLD